MKNILFISLAAFAISSVSPVFAEDAKPETAASAGPVRLSVQQRFNAAKDLKDKAKFAEAITAFDQLEADILKFAKPSENNLALVRAFRASASARLNDTPEARRQLESMLESSLKDNPARAMALQEVRMILALLYSTTLDDAAAATQYAALAKEATLPLEKAAYLAREAQMLALLDPAKSVAISGTGMTIMETLPKPDKTVLAALYNVQGRAQLNLGYAKAARAAFQKAISLKGGLDLSVDFIELSSRADAAIAALRLGDKDEARNLLAYTGAGRTKVAFPSGIDMALPQCGGIEGLRPDDSAIVEFAIGRDGRVLFSRPVLANRPGPMAYVFARAISDWRWDPLSISEITDFFLSSSRVEVRCSNSFQRPSIMADLGQAMNSWFDSKGANLPNRDESEPIERWLARPEIANDPLVKARAHEAYASDALTGEDQRLSNYAIAERLLRENSAPVSVWIMPAVASRFSWLMSSGGRRLTAKSTSDLAKLVNDPAVVVDRRVSAQVSMILANVFAMGRDFDAEREALVRVKDDGALANNDPLKVAALVALANLAVVKGDLAQAKLAYEQTGLSARQCAALDSKPVMLRTNAGSDDFPMEAMAWGFEGWVRQEFDVKAEGRTENVRTVIAFPPSVFSEAGEAMAKNFRYRASFRPEGGLGCGGNTEIIKFRGP